jgi:site-specific recombinase XerD
MTKSNVTVEVKREIDRYRQFMLEHEYTDKTATGYGSFVSQFLCRSARDANYPLQESISGFLNIQRVYGAKSFKGCRAALRFYFKMSTGKSYPKRPPRKYNPSIEAVTKRFYDYSIIVKHMQAASAMWEAANVRGFLEFLKIKEPCRYENITAHSIREFAVSRLGHLTDSSKGRTVTAIRNFFRFQRFEGIPVHKTVFQLPLSPAVWKNWAFPKTIEETVFNRLHEIPDGNTSTGRRDRCMEVAALAVDDFNWREDVVTIKNTKNCSDRKLPVSGKLGQAVIEYLVDSRPRTTSGTLSVRFKHTRGEPMGVSQIRCVVRRVYLKTGTKIHSTGTHILRRTAAGRIYNAGNSLKMTGDILGHKSLDSTAQYVKTDITGLRQVAAHWPQPARRAGIHDGK